MKGHKKRVSSIAFDPFDRNRLISGSHDRTIKIWDISKPDGKEFVKSLEFEFMIKEVLFVPFYKNLISFSRYSKEIKICDISRPKGKEIIKVLKTGGHFIQSLTCSTLSKSVIASGDMNGIIEVWDVKNIDFIKKLKRV